VSRNGYFGPVVTQVAARVLLTLTLASVVRAQTTNPLPSPEQPPILPTAGTGIENQGQLGTVIVTGYIVPRAGEGTQPVATIDQTFIENQGDQTVSEVIQKLPQNIGAFTPSLTPAPASRLRALQRTFTVWALVRPWF
jgi:hypothetical protein